MPQWRRRDSSDIPIATVIFSQEKGCKGAKEEEEKNKVVFLPFSPYGLPPPAAAAEGERQESCLRQIFLSFRPVTLRLLLLLHCLRWALRPFSLSISVVRPRSTGHLWLEQEQTLFKDRRRLMYTWLNNKKNSNADNDISH